MLRVLDPDRLCTAAAYSRPAIDPLCTALRCAATSAADAGRPLRWIEARGQAADHPVIVQIPETGYLKGAILQAM